MSFPADIAEGTSYGSSTVTFLYPLLAKWSAVEAPQVPQPTTRIGDNLGSDIVLIPL